MDNAAPLRWNSDVLFASLQAQSRSHAEVEAKVANIAPAAQGEFAGFFDVYGRHVRICTRRMMSWPLGLSSCERDQAACRLEVGYGLVLGVLNI